METNYTLKRLKLIWPVFALFMFASLFVNAQDKALEVLKLTIECDGIVLVRDANTGEAVATIQGPVVDSEIPVSLNQLIWFFTSKEEVPWQSPGTLLMEWKSGEFDPKTVIGTKPDLKSVTGYPAGVPMMGDYLFITARFADRSFGSKIEGPGDIATITGTPVTIPLTTTYGETTECWNPADAVGLTVNGMVSTDRAGGFPAGTRIVEVGYKGGDADFFTGATLYKSPTYAGFYLGEKNDVLLSDIIGGDPVLLSAALANPGFVENWYFVVESTTFVGNFDVEFSLVNYTAANPAEKFIMDTWEFNIAYGEVEIAITEANECFDDELCFSVTIEYPAIFNIDAFGGDIPPGQVLANGLITSDKAFPVGTTITWDYNGLADGTCTLLFPTSEMYVSQLVECSLAHFQGLNPLVGHGGLTDTWTICIDDYAGATETAATFNLDFDFLAQLYVPGYATAAPPVSAKPKDYVYASESTTLKALPVITFTHVPLVNYVCGLNFTFDLESDYDGTLPAGKWVVKTKPVGATVDFLLDRVYAYNAEIVVSSYGRYTFEYVLDDPGAYCDVDMPVVEVRFYPGVKSDISRTAAQAEVCSLATSFTASKTVDPVGSLSTAWGGQFITEHVWKVYKWTWLPGATAATSKWDWVVVPGVAWGNTILQGTSATNFVFDAPGFGKYRVEHFAQVRPLTSVTATPATYGAALCDSKPVKTIDLEFFWKPRAEANALPYDECKFLPHTGAGAVAPIKLVGNVPNNVKYKATTAATTNTIQDPYMNGKGTWELISSPTGSAVTYVTGTNMNATEIEFFVSTWGDYTFRYTVTNEGSPCEVAYDEVTVSFPEPLWGAVNTQNLIYCFTQVKHENYMDILTGTNKYDNLVFTGAAGEDGKIQINKNWVSNYNFNKLQLNGTKSFEATGTWSIMMRATGEDVWVPANEDKLHVALVEAVKVGDPIDPRDPKTWKLASWNKGDAVAVFLYPGIYQFTWTVKNDCDLVGKPYKFEVEMLASPDPLKILEVTEGGEIVPPRPVCVTDEVHYILRRTTTGLDPVAGNNDVIWDIPANFQVNATGGGGGINQYWVKGVWTSEVAGAHFEVEEFGHPIHGCPTVNKFDPVLYRPSLPEGLTITGPRENLPAGIVQTYSIPEIDLPGVTYLWTVVGGTIQSGQGTHEVKVLWHETATTRSLKVDYSGADFCNTPQSAGPITVTIESGLLAGQIRYWNSEETFMPSPFNTLFQGNEEIPDYFYVELHIADEDGNPSGSYRRVDARNQIAEDGSSYRTYFEFEDVDITKEYIIRVLDGGYYNEGLTALDARLAYTWTWRNWGGVNATDALAIQMMVARADLNEAPYNLPWFGDEEDDYGFFSFQTADVNSSGTITMADRTNLLYRVVGFEQQFPNETPNFRVAGRMVDGLGDAGKTWPQAFDADADTDIVFNKQAAAYLGQTTSARVHGYLSEVISFGTTAKNYLNIYYVATGDLNSSYQPTADKADFSTIALNYTQDVPVEVGQTIEIPVRLDRATELGAITLGVNFNKDLIRVESVSYLGSEGLTNFSNEEGWMRVASVDNQFFGDNQAVALVTATVLGEMNSARLFTLDPITEFAGPNAKVLDVTLNTDAITTKSATSITDPSVANLSISNYPNPFTTTTTIEYTLPEAGNVTLVVYNNVGQLVTTLVSEAKEAGLHQAVMNRSDVNGDGMYIYRIFVEGQSRSYTATGNVVLMK